MNLTRTGRTLMVVLTLLASSSAFALNSSVQELSLSHPWTVQFLGGCRGVLISPSWVLTAAHCGPYINSGNAVVYRIDWAKNLNEVLPISFNPYSGQGGWNPHPNYSFSNAENDVALVHLNAPVPIDSWTQVVSLPRTPLQLGEIGTLANPSATDGLFNVFRGTVEGAGRCLGGTTDFCAKSDTAGLCEGDSGSAFVTLTGGRATVRGIISRKVGTGSCSSAGTYGEFEDISKHVPWILSTIGTTLDSLDGVSRLRSSGDTARGTTRVNCTASLGFGFTASSTENGPMNVAGAQVGVSCPAWSNRTVNARCLLDSNVSAHIVAFTLRTTNVSTGAVSVSNLPFSNASAVYTGTIPAGVVQEFDCQVMREPQLWLMSP